MAKQLFMTTTGTLSPVIFYDLGERSFTHPTSSFEITTEFSIDELQASSDFQGALSAGHISLLDENSNPVGDLASELQNHPPLTLLVGQEGASLNNQELSLLPATPTSDGLMSKAEHSKLLGIEAGATADQNAAEVPFNNTASGMTAVTAQAALDELDARLDAAEASLGSIDHGSLSGLGDDDHTQYLNIARGDARYYTEAELDAGQLDTRYYTETEVNSLLSGKANTSHTHVSGDITDFVSAVDSRVNLIVGAAPGALDTLQELADALNNDPNFHTTITNALTTKADKSNVLELDNTTAYTPTADYHPATRKYVDDLVTASGHQPVTVAVGQEGVTVSPAQELAIAKATIVADGLMSSEDYSKLLSIEAGAKDDQIAVEVPFNNTASGLAATTVQAALDEIDGAVDGISSNKADKSTTISAGDGLTGGGDLSANRVISAQAADSSVDISPAGIKVNTITDALHGSRSGGNLHPNATGSISGFMSPADKNKLDLLQDGYCSFRCGRDANGTTNVYLRTVDGAASNLAPFVMPYDATLYAITAKTPSPETWNAQVRKNAGTVISQIVITNSDKEIVSVAVNVNQGDEIKLYCQGSNISRPVIEAFFRRR